MTAISNAALTTFISTRSRIDGLNASVLNQKFVAFQALVGKL